MKSELSRQTQAGVCLLFFSLNLMATSAAEPAPISRTEVSRPSIELLYHRVNYEAKIHDDEARFLMKIDAESMARREISEFLFEGEIALLPSKLPPALRIEREGNQFHLLVSKAGRYQFNIEFVAKVRHAEPWNQLSFKGPAAVIASVDAQAEGPDVELQLTSGTLLSTAQTNGITKLKGFLGAVQTVALQWSRTGGPAIAARRAVVTAETDIKAQITPTVIKYVTQVHFEILQGKLPRLSIALPTGHALTRLAGEQIRDWEIKSGGDSGKGMQVLDVQFTRLPEKQYQLTLFSEQPVATADGTSVLTPPQPLEVEREFGALTIAAEDTLAEVDSATGLRQVNAPTGALAAYRFNGRPFSLTLKLRRIEPIITVSERISARLEETRLLSSHRLFLNIEKAGVYSLDLAPPTGFQVADVRGEGVEDWKPGEMNLKVNFASRLLGPRTLDVLLEQSLKTFPEKIILGSLRVARASKELSEIGVAAGAGIHLKTAEMTGLREVPVRNLQKTTDPKPSTGLEEMLAYKSEQPDWKLQLSTERLPARIVAEIFNLVTIGDGIVGGSATIRYGIINQGVQQFELALPTAWKNVEFTGANIRRKEQRADGTWTLGLQDKAWGGYTLVVTYDYQFDPKGATFPVGGIHTLGVERETGTISVTTAASLKLTAKSASDSLRRIDELELSAADRSLITRSVLLAYQYNEKDYQLDVEVKRFAELSVLSAVADRTQLTTVLTDAGEMLTQASFMVKNNDKQFQRFKLPTNAKFWNCHVNGQPVKAERDGEWLMAPLPRGANRNQALAVDIVYAENRNVKTGLRPRRFTLQAPQTDVPNTYAEWQLYAPKVFRLSGFAGNMTPVFGTTYDLQDAWQKFTRFYWEFLREAGPGLFLAATAIGLMVAVIGSAIRRGASGVLSVLIVFVIVAILAAMLLPALSKAKSRALRISATNNLKQIGLACRTWALDNGDRLPGSYDEMINELGTLKVTYDPESGQQFVYLGAGLELEKIQPDSIIAYSPSDVHGYRNVLFADGSVQALDSRKFEERSRLGWILPANSQQIAQNQQLAAVRGAQFQPATVQALPAASADQASNGAASTNLPAIGPRVRSIHIDIPREGQGFTFTKVLNVGQEPLGVRLGVMKLQTFQTLQMALQLAAFLTGCVVFLLQWRGARNTFVLTLALALALGAVGSLLLAWRMLHLAFIWSAPIIALTLLAWLTWRFWPRPGSSPSLAEKGLEPALPPVAASIAILLLATGMTGNAIAEESGRVVAENVARIDISPEAALKKPLDSSSRTFSILSAKYSGTVTENVAQLDVIIRIAASRQNQTISLFGDDVAVEQFTSKPASVQLLREANVIAVKLLRREETTLQLKLLVKLRGDISRRQLAFVIPAALSSRVNLTIAEPDADVEFPAAISLKRTASGQQTHIEAIMGSGQQVELFWTPRVKRADEIAANVICQNSSLITFARGMLNTRSTLDYQISQGEMRQAHVRLPAGQRLLRVEGESIRTWEVKTENEASTVWIELIKGVATGYRLLVETERALEPPPVLVKVEIPHAVDVIRETGLIALRSDEELDLAVEKAVDLYRVDTGEFSRSLGQTPSGIFNAYRFLKPDFDLETRVAVIQPQLEAVLRDEIVLGQEQVTLNSTVNYTIKRAGVFGLRLALPAGYQLGTIDGTNILQSMEREESGQRILEITLKERTSGAYALNLRLDQTIKELPKSFSIVGVHPLGLEKLTGFVSISVEPGLSVKPITFDGLTEIPAGSMARQANSLNNIVLAYRYLASEPQPGANWNLSVATEAVESWVRAEIVQRLTLAEALISGRAIARFDIQNAPLKELRLRVPEAFKNVDISGPNIRRRDHAGEVWRIEFQSKIRGNHMLNITWEQPRTTKTNFIELHGIAADNVERETGILAIIARSSLQITPVNIGELKSIDLRDLPEWAGPADESTVLAYRYLRPGYTLGLEAKHFAEAEVLQALIESLKLSTVVADDGQMMTEMSLMVRNQGRQHLEISLPKDSKVWSAFVSGQAVRPSVKDGKLLLPLEQSVGDEAAIPIELVYVGANRFPMKSGSMELISPQLDAPLKSARWELFLPPDYQYTGFGGTMTHEIENAISESASFSFLDYSSRESKGKAELVKEMKSEISTARKKLSKGNVKEALADYNRVRSKGNLAADQDNEAKELETDLRRAQGNNLIQAQNAFSNSNHDNVTASQQRASGIPQTQYDTAAAEAQWTKLQQAQDLAVAKVQPIRVNLPTRGLRHSFTQVLQSEGGKPLTIRMTASNLHAISWSKRIIGPMAAFMVLWGLVALITQRASRRKEPQACS